VWLIAGGVAKYARLPHDVKVVEGTINEPMETVAGRVIEHAPDVVGISTYIWNAGMLPELLALLRQRLPGVIIVLGGPEASHNAGYWLAHGADHVLCGEGERSFAALLDGVACPCDNDYIDPYTDEYFAALNGRMAYLETSRGCPFHCAFCLSGGTGVRFFPLETVKKQIDRLSISGTKTIKLVDRTFNCNPERAYEIFEYVINLDTPCRFHFEVAADLFDARTLALLATAPPGRIQMEAGLQSFFKPALSAVCRQTDLDKAEASIRTIIKGGNIHMHVDLIAGLPYETLPAIMDSFDRAYALGAHNLQLGFLKLLHGTPLRQQAKVLGIIYKKEPPYEIISSPWLSQDDIQALKQTENALQRTHNKGRFLPLLERAIPASKLRPFEFFHALGKAAPNHGLSLEVYTRQVNDFVQSLLN